MKKILLFLLFFSTFARDQDDYSDGMIFLGFPSDYPSENDPNNSSYSDSSNDNSSNSESNSNSSEQTTTSSTHHHNDDNDFRERINDQICDSYRNDSLNNHYSSNSDYLFVRSSLENENIKFYKSNQTVSNVSDRVILNCKDLGTLEISHDYLKFLKCEDDRFKNYQEKDWLILLDKKNIQDFTHKDRMLLLCRFHLYQFDSFKFLIKKFPEYNKMMIAVLNNLRNDRNGCLKKLLYNARGWSNGHPTDSINFRNFLVKEGIRAEKELKQKLNLFPNLQEFSNDVPKNENLKIAIEDVNKFLKHEKKISVESLKQITLTFDKFLANDKQKDINLEFQSSDEMNISYKSYEFEFRYGRNVRINVIKNENLLEKTFDQFVLMDFLVDPIRKCITMIYQNSKSIIEIIGSNSDFARILNCNKQFVEFLKNNVNFQNCIPLFKSITSIIFNFIPIIGELKSGAEAVYGKDLITNAKLNNLNRAFCCIGAIPLIGYLKKGFQCLKQTSKTAKLLCCESKVVALVERNKDVAQVAKQFNCPIIKTTNECSLKIEKLIKPIAHTIRDNTKKIIIEIKGDLNFSSEFFDKILKEFNCADKVETIIEEGVEISRVNFSGNFCTFRKISSSGPPTIDINLKAINDNYIKIKFVN